MRKFKCCICGNTKYFTTPRGQPGYLAHLTQDDKGLRITEVIDWIDHQRKVVYRSLGEYIGDRIDPYRLNCENVNCEYSHAHYIKHYLDDDYTVPKSGFTVFPIEES